MNLYGIFSQRIKERPLFGVLLAFFFYLLAGIVLVSFFRQAVAVFMGLDEEGIKQILAGDFVTHPNAKAYFLVSQGLHQAVSYGLTAWFMMSLAGYSMEERGLGKNLNISLLLLASIAMLGAILWGPLLNFDPNKTYLPEAFAQFEKGFQEIEFKSKTLITTLLDVDSPMGLIPIVLVMAVLPAICEELFFRAFLQQQLAKEMRPLVAVLTSSFVFSFLHFQFHGLFGRFALGFLLGWMLWKSKSIYPSMIGHFVFNGVSLLGAYMALQSEQVGVENGELLSISWYYSLLAFLASVVSLYLFHLISTRLAPHEEKDQ